jgi:hypothetical protein
MPVLSIIACGMFEDELAYVLSEDNELTELILVENSEHFGLQRKLKSLGCLPALIPLDRISEILKEEHNHSRQAILKSLCGFRFIEKIRHKMEKQNKSTVVANMLRRGLHKNVELLKAEVYRNIREMSQFSDGILVFYGTCGLSLVNLEKDGCQLYFLKDEKGETVEDCISASLGGNDAYVRTLVNCESAGMFYLTPMWASSWEDLPKDKMFDIKYLKRYERVAKVNTGLSYEPDFDIKVRDFARFFNLKVTELKGSKKVVEQSYKNAKGGIKTCNRK